MKLRLVSDLHLEFYYDLWDAVVVDSINQRLTIDPETKLSHLALQHFDKVLAPLPDDAKTVLVIAGDLATVRHSARITNFLRLALDRFERVIYVLGNHEFYRLSLPGTESELLKAVRAVEPLAEALDTRLFIAGNTTKSIVLEDELTNESVGFIFGTMWTDFNGGDPVAKLTCQRYIQDFRLIYRWFDTLDPILPGDVATVYYASWQDMKTMLQRNNAEGLKTVVITHHMPSHDLVDAQYRRDATSLLVNGAFAANADELILNYEPALWLYGHTHTPGRTMIGRTECVCNAYGYPNERNLQEKRFDPELVLEL
jgi:predicted phosphodiesterase